MRLIELNIEKSLKIEGTTEIINLKGYNVFVDVNSKCPSYHEVYPDKEKLPYLVEKHKLENYLLEKYSLYVPQ